MTEWERMTTGRLYNADSVELVKPHTKGMALCEKLNKTSIKRARKKEKLLNRLIPTAIGKDIMVFTPFYCEYGKNIFVGKNCFVNYNCVFLDVAPITLGDCVWIGANVTLATPMHPFLADERIIQEYPDGVHDLEYGKPIVIGNNTWICSGAVISGGVTIGENCVIAAGAVVTKDIPANSMVGGVPARVIRTLDEGDRLDAWNTYLKNEFPEPRRSKKD